MIKMVPHYVADDGQKFTDLERAVARERHLGVTELLIRDRAKIGLELNQIEMVAKAICLTHSAVRVIFDTKHGAPAEALFQTERPRALTDDTLTMRHKDIRANAG